MRPATVRSAVLREARPSAWNKPFRSGSCRGCKAADIAIRLRPPDELLDPFSLVARQIVPDDDVAFREGGDETFFHPFLEGGRVDRPVEGLLRHEAAKAQAGDQPNRLVMAVRNGGAQPSAAPTASAFARHIRRSPGLLDEHQAGRIEIELPGKPVAALSHNVRVLLLLGVRGLLWNGPPLLPAS
jgi:hypothetical protein